MAPYKYYLQLHLASMIAVCSYVYRFGHPFELPLLIQSVIMNAAMFAMVYICITVRQKSDVSKLRQFSGSRIV